VPGITGGTRYRVGAAQAPGAAAPQHEYLTIYEIEGEPGEVMAELAGRRARGDWSPRRGLDEETIVMLAFERVDAQGRRNW
jgi:hypothetical protein